MRSIAKATHQKLAKEKMLIRGTSSIVAVPNSPSHADNATQKPSNGRRSSQVSRVREAIAKEMSDTRSNDDNCSDISDAESELSVRQSAWDSASQRSHGSDNEEDDDVGDHHDTTVQMNFQGQQRLSVSLLRAMEQQREAQENSDKS